MEEDITKRFYEMEQRLLKFKTELDTVYDEITNKKPQPTINKFSPEYRSKQLNPDRKLSSLSRRRTFNLTEQLLD